MKKIITFLIIFSLAANLAGCAALQKKFTRKKKAGVKAPRIYQVKIYEKKPTPELYKKHYTFWSGWQSELVQVLGENHKKDMRCIEEIVSNLKDMQNILTEEKAKALDPHIDKLAAVGDMIFKSEVTRSNRESIIRALDRESRAIKKDFNYRKVKDYLKKSFDENESHGG